MTKADNNIFTTEHQLSSRYVDEIAHFWQQGNFSHFSGIDNVRINYATFINTTGIMPSKCLVISSGRSESYLKYKELSFDLFNNGYSIFLIDHRGQGLSEHLLANVHKGHIDNFQYYVDDLTSFIENIVTPHCQGSKPYLLAHSMGAAIGARYLQDFPNKIQAAVLSSPMFGFNSGSVPEFIAESALKISAQLNQWFDDTPWYFPGHKDFSHNAFSDNILMHSPIRYQIFSQLYNTTPEIQLGGVTVYWLTESQKALDKIFNNIDKITAPTLVLQAGQDKIIKNQAQNDFCQQLHLLQPHSCPNGKPLIIDDAYHELFFESDVYREQALNAVMEWFEKH
ncbi:alpha/beta fold hydrolase [Candidatus Colwellia aromaticivorans]|uniref:alpha/beta fold hydrolase n=1 Tax=Candidatus Colwellia aromaticivorans TaxID=2267621 RepID=UPI000DF258FF|nr:alpha/beta fold hydrolase [Candidatus Colwellia aromaticivorans]